MFKVQVGRQAFGLVGLSLGVPLKGSIRLPSKRDL